MNETKEISDRDISVLTRYQTVLDLEKRGLSFKEIGEILDISPQRASQIFKKAKCQADIDWADGLDLRARNLLIRLGFRSKSEVASVFNANPQFFRLKNQNLGPNGLDRLAIWLGRKPPQTYPTLILDFIPVRKNAQGDYVSLNGNALPTYRVSRAILLDVTTNEQYAATLGPWGTSPVILESLQSQVDLRTKICSLRGNGIPFVQVAATLKLPEPHLKQLAADTECAVCFPSEFDGLDGATRFILNELGYKNLVEVRIGIELGTLTPTCRRYPWHNMKLGAIRYRNLAERVRARIPIEYVELTWAPGLHYRCRLILARFGANSIQSALGLIGSNQLKPGTQIPGIQESISEIDARILENWAAKQTGAESTNS